ncbi:MAG: hypothetical protein ACFFCI_09395 [Promethearchaeota archaeon]
MDIRKTRMIFIIFIFSFFLLSSNSFKLRNGIWDQIQPLTSDPELPDKVYAFLSPSDTLTLDNLYMEKYYKYYIWIEIVTPHNCTINISLWDPEGKQFDLFENILSYYEFDGTVSERYKYYEIPFGTALSGNYIVKFHVITSNNVNIYIRIEKGPKCLYDKIAMEEYEDIMFYKVTRFYNGMNISHSIRFKSDYMYKFYIERVSPISIHYSNQTYIDLSLRNPEDLEYQIYSNYSLTPINEIQIFKFGTASEGEYILNITLRSKVEYVNIGYAVIELYKISQGVDPNQTIPSNSTHSRKDFFSIPEEWTIGIIIFFGAMITGLIIVVSKKRSRNISRFRERI